MRDQLIPLFPRTPHLPGSRLGVDDIVDHSLTNEKLQSSASVTVTEKLDGANVRIRFNGIGEPLVGNREKLLSKSYSRKDTPAKLQFRPLWGWVYEHREAFAILANNSRVLGFGTTSIYGEWLWTRHTIGYDKLSAYFVAFDLGCDDGFIDPGLATRMFQAAGFVTPPDVKQEIAPLSVETLVAKAAGPSCFGAEGREGLYIKTGDGRLCTGRYKVVRSDYSPRLDFNDTPMTRNQLAK